MSGTPCVQDNKIEVLGDPRSVSLEGLDVGPDAGSGSRRGRGCSRFRFRRSMYQGGLARLVDVGRDDLAGDGQRGRLRVVVDVAVARRRAASRTPRRAGARKAPRRTYRRPWRRVSGSSSVSRAPLCSHSQRMLTPDLAGRHVLHQIEHVVVAEEVGRLERRGLETLPKALPYCRATLSRSRAPRTVRGAGSSSTSPSASSCV